MKVNIDARYDADGLRESRTDDIKVKGDTKRDEVKEM